MSCITNYHRHKFPSKKAQNTKNNKNSFVKLWTTNVIGFHRHTKSNNCTSKTRFASICANKVAIGQHSALKNNIDLLQLLFPYPLLFKWYVSSGTESWTNFGIRVFFPYQRLVSSNHLSVRSNSFQLRFVHSFCWFPANFFSFICGAFHVTYFFMAHCGWFTLDDLVWGFGFIVVVYEFVISSNLNAACLCSYYANLKSFFESCLSWKPFLTFSYGCPLFKRISKIACYAGLRTRWLFLTSLRLFRADWGIWG